MSKVSPFECIWCFLLRMKLYIFGKNPREVIPFSMLPYTGVCDIDASLLAILTLIAWLKWRLPGFATVKPLFFFLKITTILWEIYEDHGSILFYIRLSPANVLATINGSCMQWLLLWCVIMLLFHFSYSFHSYSFLFLILLHLLISILW